MTAAREVLATARALAEIARCDPSAANLQAVRAALGLVVRHDEHRYDQAGTAASGHGYNPYRDKSGKFAPGQHAQKSSPAERQAAVVAKAQERVGKAKARVEAHASKLAAAHEGKHAALAETRSALEKARAAAEMARAKPTQKNVKAAQVATNKATRAQTKVDKHEAAIAKHTEAHAKAATAHAKAVEAHAKAMEASGPKIPDHSVEPSRPSFTHPAPEPDAKAAGTRAKQALASGDLTGAAHHIDSYMATLGMKRTTPEGKVAVNESVLERVASDGRRYIAHGTNDGRGNVYLSAETARNAQDYGAGSMRPGTGFATHAIVHELSHNYTPITDKHYEKSGAKIEEVTTELAARRIGYDMFNIHVGSTGGYQEQISQVSKAVEKVTGLPSYQSERLLGDAALRFKARPAFTGGVRDGHERIKQAFSEDLAHVLGVEHAVMHAALKKEKFL